MSEVVCADAVEWLESGDADDAALIVTSPNYNAGMDYGAEVDDAVPWADYEKWAVRWVGSVAAALCQGGRLCINVAAMMGRSPAYPLARLYLDAILYADLHLRGEIIWDKGPSRNNSTAWGSWCSPANPSLRDSYEVVLVASKGDYALKGPHGAESDLTAEEFTRDTNSLWRIPCETKRDHPAPFPVALAERLIKLYSWPGQMVLDPFAGSGSTGVAAVKHGREFRGCDISQAYVDMANERIRREREQMMLRWEV